MNILKSKQGFANLIILSVLVLFAGVYYATFALFPAAMSDWKETGFWGMFMVGSFLFIAWYFMGSGGRIAMSTIIASVTVFFILLPPVALLMAFVATWDFLPNTWAFGFAVITMLLSMAGAIIVHRKLRTRLTRLP